MEDSSERKCIWCPNLGPGNKFEKEAHTIPKSLGGVKLCLDVCDTCNHYFGSRKNGLPSVEIVLKEAFNLSRHVLSTATNSQQKLSRFKSEFFNLNLSRRPISLTVKPRFKMNSSFLQTLGRQLRRGIYKMFLEERMRVKGDGHESRFDFMREFARYNIGDWPLFILVPRFQVIMSYKEGIRHPELIFNNESEQFMREYNIYIFHFVGHMLAIPTSRLFDLTFESFRRKVISEMNTVSDIVPLIKFNDLDVLFYRTLHS